MLSQILENYKEKITLCLKDTPEWVLFEKEVSLINNNNYNVENNLSYIGFKILSNIGNLPYMVFESSIDEDIKNKVSLLLLDVVMEIFKYMEDHINDEQIKNSLYSTMSYYLSSGEIYYSKEKLLDNKSGILKLIKFSNYIALKNTNKFNILDSLNPFLYFIKDFQEQTGVYEKDELIFIENLIDIILSGTGDLEKFFNIKIELLEESLKNSEYRSINIEKNKQITYIFNKYKSKEDQIFLNSPDLLEKLYSIKEDIPKGYYELKVNDNLLNSIKGDKNEQITYNCIMKIVEKNLLEKKFFKFAEKIMKEESFVLTFKTENLIETKRIINDILYNLMNEDLTKNKDFVLNYIKKLREENLRKKASKSNELIKNNKFKI